MSEAVDLSGARILVVDDVVANIEVLRQLLEENGYEIFAAPNGEIALRVAAESRPDLVLLDVVMPGIDGFEVCRRLRQRREHDDVPIIFITARDEPEQMVAGFAAGGVDYIVKPFQKDELLARVRTHLEKHRLTRELKREHQALLEETARREAMTSERDHLAGQLSLISEREAERWGIEGFVGQSQTIRGILEEVALLQEARATSVLISGESGTGKELIARAIHYGGRRGEGPFVPVNCSAIPGELVESFFFGHKKGAFTGADKDRQGYFEAADGGTLFLDEIGDMPLELQPKLLRVLEDGEVVPIGTDQGRKVDVRVVAATNADMQKHIADGRFRQDLYFRLAGFTVAVPPLREHCEDVGLLAQHFIRLFAAEMGREPPPLSKEGLAALQGYGFPGNVRELKNIIERALIASRGGAIGPEHLRFLEMPVGGAGMAAEAKPGRAGSKAVTDRDDRVGATAGGVDGQVETPAPGPPLSLAEAEAQAVRRALAHAGGNTTEAARILGISRNRVYRILQRSGEQG